MAEKRIKLITFDAAGTLIESRWEPAELILRAAEEHGILLDKETAKRNFEKIHSLKRAEHEEVELRKDPAEIRAFWQGEIAEWLASIGENPSLSRDLYEWLTKSIFSTDGMVFRLYSDVVPTLQQLRKSNLKLGVLSNWDSSLHKVIDNLELREYFDFIIPSLEIGIEKPNKGIFREALHRAKVSPNEALHIGDSFEDDYLGAKSAGWNARLIVRNNEQPHLVVEDKPLQSLLEVTQVVGICA